MQRLAERGIARQAVLAVLLSGELIEDYPDDTPYPSALFLGFVADKPLHAVAPLMKSTKKLILLLLMSPHWIFLKQITKPGEHNDNNPKS